MSFEATDRKQAELTPVHTVVFNLCRYKKQKYILFVFILICFSIRVCWCNLVTDKKLTGLMGCRENP